MKRAIGKCSLCGGRVTVPTIWLGVIPPTPTCESCGAVAETPGPVIPMRPKKARPYGPGRCQACGCHGLHYCTGGQPRHPGWMHTGERGHTVSWLVCK